MESVIIVAPVAYEAEFRERLDMLGHVSARTEGSLLVEDGNSRIYFGRNDSVRDELEPERLQLIMSKIAQPVFYCWPTRN